MPFDASQESYISTNTTTGVITDHDADKVSVTVVDQKTLKPKIVLVYYVDYLKRNTVMKDDYISSSRTYVPKQIQSGDTVEFAIIEDADAKKSYAVSISILARKNGLVPPATIASRHRFQHHECQNFINNLTDDSEISADTVSSYGFNELAIRQLKLDKLADRLYGKQNFAKPDDKTLKAPAATPTKDKPLTEKK